MRSTGPPAGSLSRTSYRSTAPGTSSVCVTTLVITSPVVALPTTTTGTRGTRRAHVERRFDRQRQLLSVELGDEILRRGVAVGVFENPCDLVPVRLFHAG